jgi:hypothetical protein
MSSKLAAAALASILAGAAAASCSVENTNHVACIPADCAVTCAVLGYETGACVDGACACDLGDTDTYSWDAGADAAASAAGDRG